MKLNWRVSRYDIDAGSLTRVDGTTVHADLIVAADGEGTFWKVEETLIKCHRHTVTCSTCSPW